VATAVKGVSIADSDASVANETITTTLSDTGGILTVVNKGGVVTGSGSTKLTIAGTLSQVDADLATLTYKKAATGGDTISITANDGNGGTAAPASIAVTVGSGPAAVDLSLFSQYVASGFGADGAGAGLAVYHPQAVQHLELAGVHH